MEDLKADSLAKLWGIEVIDVGNEIFKEEDFEGVGGGRLEVSEANSKDVDVVRALIVLVEGILCLVDLPVVS